LARKILLADDSVTAQNMGRKILADAGYEVITVNNGSAALKKISEQKPDLIVLDVYMPGYSGLEVCQRLKEVGETARIPVLLTVGKLEPFKTDEAKRVRADGYIVKPFEASELLSALSKLEDKIVPNAESKPGRFARATAAIDEGRDRTVAAEEDNGWRSRISFPSKRKKEEPAPAPPADDPAIYNPVNKDLRTVVEHHAAPAAESHVHEERVDVGALAPEGLPKDVTPEEIAAIAAAAAQMQSKVLESKAAEERETPSEAKAEAPRAEEVKVDSATEAATVVPAMATFAEQQSEEKDKGVSAGSPLADEVNAAEAQPAEYSSSSHAAEEPVTMAAGAGASGSRWTAVAVALAPEESGITLEQEMQRAYAEFTAQAEHVSAEVAAVPSVEVVTPAMDAAITGSAGDPLQAGSVSVETTTAVVKDFESVGVRAAAEEQVANLESPAAAVEQVPTVSEPETSARAEQVAVTEAAEPLQPESSAQAGDAKSEQTVTPEVVTSETAITPVESSGAAEDQAAESQSDTSELSAEISSAIAAEVAAAGSEDPVKKESDSDLSATTAAAWASWRKIRDTGDSHSAHSGERSQGRESSEDAAMAVAAGAEKAPEDAQDGESDNAIASLVESVLADLRPKIVEEISRKLGKKK
jgi:CheY-like chemotaxis protein